MKKIITIISLVLILGACTTSGIYVSEEDAKSFYKGETTLTEVVEKLGRPSQKSITSDGTTEIIYNYIETQIRPQTFIPYIGILSSGADIRANDASFYFDRNNILIEYKFSSYEMGNNTGLNSDVKLEKVETKSRKNK